MAATVEPVLAGLEILPGLRAAGPQMVVKISVDSGAATKLTKNNKLKCPFLLIQREPTFMCMDHSKISNYKLGGKGLCLIFNDM